LLTKTCQARDHAGKLLLVGGHELLRARAADARIRLRRGAPVAARRQAGRVAGLGERCSGRFCGWRPRCPRSAERWRDPGGA